jgi:2-aminobenzoate-CoA ligase
MECPRVPSDIFEMDGDGYLTYHARSDSMIVSSGDDIGAPEVEAAIDKHPLVLESVVVARPDPERGSVDIVAEDEAGSRVEADAARVTADRT